MGFLKRLVLLALVMLPVESVSFAAQAALSAGHMKTDAHGVRHDSRSCDSRGGGG